MWLQLLWVLCAIWSTPQGSYQFNFKERFPGRSYLAERT